MCGIAGIWNRDGRPAAEPVLARMIARIGHRGPDDRAVRASGPVGLAHARLSILDLSERGRQPFVLEDGRGAIVHSGEIYNFRELRGRLETEGVRFTSGTDTEVVLHALDRWGPREAVPLLDGMFAFAYHDARTGTLWLARDRAGMKPLYHASRGALFGFASEIKALLEHPAIEPRPDLHALTTQVVFGQLAGTWTPFEGVSMLPPGSLMEITVGGERTESLLRHSP